MYKLLLAIIATGTFAATANAQNARVQRFTVPLAGSVVLKDVEDKYNAYVANMEMPVPDAGSEKAKLIAVKEQVRKTFPYKKLPVSLNKTTAAVSPYVVKGFVADSLPGIPPDNDMAISKGEKAVSVINSSIAVLNGDNGQMLYRKGLLTFSASVGLINPVDYRYDPKVIYDPEADRFICVMLNSTGPSNHIVTGFSETNDPAGKWNFYKFYGNFNNDSTWLDYPAIAMTHNELFLTGNKIKFNQSWQTGFSETVIYQIRKADGYAGSMNLNYQIWDSIAANGPFIRNLFPVKGGTAINGPDMYFLSNRNFDVQNDSVFLLHIPDTIGSTNNQIDIKVLTSPMAYGVPPNGRQVDTFELATNDARVLGAYMENGSIEFVSTSVHPVNGASCIYHGHITDYATATPTLAAEFFTVDTLDFGYPNISFAGWDGSKNTSFISFNYTGPNTYAGVGAILYDGTQFSDLVKVKEGVNSIEVLNSKVQRWGDYMGSQIEYDNIGNAWIEGIYGRADKEYGNWMAKLSIFPVSVAKNKKDVCEAVLYPNPAFKFISMDFSLEEKGVYTFSIYDMQGRLVDNILHQQCKAGKNRIDFNVASLPAGNYVLKAANEKGAQVLTRTFVRQ